MFLTTWIVPSLLTLLLAHHRLDSDDFEPSPGLDYLDIPAPSDMRYNHQEPNPSSLTIEAQPHPSGIFQQGPQSILNTTSGYSSDALNSSYAFSGGLSFRPSSSTPATGMAQGRPTALPNPSYNTRDIYRATPLFTRPEHTQRSPPFGAHPRRHPLSPTPSPSTIGYPPASSLRMDGTYGKNQQNIPPLQALVTHGQLTIAGGHNQPIKIDIQGTIDKGFFLSDGEWTCYRRNYFSCICSYSLTPNYPGSTIQYTPNASNPSGTIYDVYGFAMSISAVVADSDSHTIDLVQHTPKRDKGPVSRPDRVPLSPKQPQSHPLGGGIGGGMYSDNRMGIGSASGDMYSQGFNQPQGGSHATEHTFERIQFKQATANNGKRRAAQQYYHLVVELHAHVGEVGRGAPDQWMRIAHRKSAKMIVRGRSPGHYQTERRGSASSGPGGSSGTLGSYTGSQGLGDYSSGPSLLGPGGYGVGGYDPRTSHYGSSRHHDLSFESAQDMKDDTKDASYRYYPGMGYDGADPRQPIEMFRHGHEQDTVMTTLPGNTELPAPRVKHENDPLRSYYLPGPAYTSRGCNQMESKSSSAGWYPMMVAQSSAVP